MIHPKLSLLVSIYNRSELFRWGLASWFKQTLPADQWEILLLDDQSTEKLSEVYQPYLGRLNLTHVRMDHTRHPIFQEFNPNWDGKSQPTWFHTPALSNNIGIRKARGEFVVFLQPEIILNREALERMLRWLEEHPRMFGFGQVALTSPGFREWVTCSFLPSSSPDTEAGWKWFWQAACDQGAQVFQDHELYWYAAGVSTAEARAIGGVDEDYLRGVYGEDDNFKKRLQLAGVGNGLVPGMQGLHLDHSHEGHWPAQRTSEHWNKAAERNRAKWHAFNALGDAAPPVANVGQDWGSEACIQWLQAFEVR